MPGSIREQRRWEPGHIRAFGAEDAQTQVHRRMVAMGRLGISAPQIARALRQARKASLARSRSYDPVAHAALCRLFRGEKDKAPCPAGARHLPRGQAAGDESADQATR